MVESTSEAELDENELPKPSDGVAEEEAAGQTRAKKKGLPAWVIAVVLAVTLGAVLVVYANLLKEPPPHILHNKKASND